MRKQASQSEGAIKYDTRGELRKKHFYTMSIWKDRDSMDRFVKAEPHATAVKRFYQDWGSEGSFVEWISPDNKIDWDEAKRRLQNPTFQYKPHQVSS